MELLLTELRETQTLALAGGLLLLFIAETVHPFYPYFNGAFRKRSRHALRNLIIGALNAALVSLAFTGLWLSASLWAEEHHFGILHWLWSSSGMPLWLHAAGALILLDGWTYLWHRVNHIIRFLWRFHRLHHSDPTLDVTTASRFHPGEIVFSSVLRIPVILLSGIHLWELVFYETLMFAVVQFHHSNIGLPRSIDRALRLVIISPDMHKVHHSRRQPETDSNYGSLFSIWDRVFGTFRLNTKPETICFGLEEFNRDEDQTVNAMLKTPAITRKKPNRT